METIVKELPDDLKSLSCPLGYCGKPVVHISHYPFEEGSCYVECAGGHQFVAKSLDASIQNKPVGDPVKCSEGSKGG
jgi:hypothetical protein